MKARSGGGGVDTQEQRGSGGRGTDDGSDESEG